MTARWDIPRRFGPAVVLLSLLAAPAFASTAHPPSRFQLSGSGSLSAPAVTMTQTGAGLSLRATLSPASTASVAQSALGYTLTGKLAEVPLVCYADTIFRDGFEVY